MRGLDEALILLYITREGIVDGSTRCFNTWYFETRDTLEGG